MDGVMPAGAPGVQPGERVPDAGPLVAADGSVSSLRELLRAPELQLWLCAGTTTPDRAVELAERLGPTVRTRVLVIRDRPPAAPEGVEILADPELRAHGRLGAVSDTAYVVRPDGYLAFRCEPPDADWLARKLGSLGVRALAGQGRLTVGGGSLRATRYAGRPRGIKPRS